MATFQNSVPFHNNKAQNKFTFDYLLYNLCDVTKHNNLL